MTVKVVNAPRNGDIQWHEQQEWRNAIEDILKEINNQTGEAMRDKKGSS